MKNTKLNGLTLKKKKKKRDLFENNKCQPHGAISGKDLRHQKHSDLSFGNHEFTSCQSPLILCRVVGEAGAYPS